MPAPLTAPRVSRPTVLNLLASARVAASSAKIGFARSIAAHYDAPAPGSVADRALTVLREAEAALDALVSETARADGTCLKCGETDDEHLDDCTVAA